MRFLQDLPIKRKLFAGIFAICLTALLLACAALFWFQSATFRKGFTEELESLGAITAHNCAAPLAFNDRKSALEVLAALGIKPHITAAHIFDGEGKLFASLGDARPVSNTGRVPVGRGVILDDGWASLSLPVPVQDARPGRLEIRARFADKHRELLSLYARVTSGVLLGSLAVIVLMTSVLQRLITGPIVALAEVARNVSEKEDYTQRAPDAGRDEAGLLTQTFNRMLEQIQSRDASLRESRQRFEVAVMGSSDGLWDWDLAANTVYLSPRWKSMLGYADDELPNSPDSFRRVLHPDDAAQVLSKVEAYLAGRDAAYEIEFRARHKDGGHRWILSRGAALRDGQGKPFRFAGSHTDITERKRAETELRMSREKFETLVNSIDGVVWEADLKTSAFTFVSRQAERLLGYPAGQWIDEPAFWADHLHPDDREAAIRACTEAAARRKPLRCEYRMIAADGREVWVRDIASVSQDPDGTDVLRGVLFDISEQKRAEEELALLNRRLVDASRQAGMAEVATGVLHNVGNVLNSVNVSATLVAEQLRKSRTASLGKVVKLLDEHADDLGEFMSRDPKGRQLPAFLAKLSEHLTVEQQTLVKELDALRSNLEHIKQIVAMQQSYARVSGVLEPASPGELFEDALRLNSSAMAGESVEIVRAFETVPAVLVDRHKVLQILVNLVENARQSVTTRPEGRQLTLRIARKEDGRVRMEVSDNGAGISKENLTRIFGHGFTTKKTGHGFGLHASANAAREMGGNLTAHSEGPGHGATFTLELPAATGKELPRAA